MIYALINFNKLNLSTLNFNCLGFVHEKYQCKKTITIAANEKAKRILQNLDIKGKKKSICCSIILLADACICQEHPRRPTAIVYAATGWLADLSITLGEGIKLAECSKCNVVTTSTNKDNTTPVQQDKKVTSCFQKFLSQTQQLEETIIDLRSHNTKLEGANSQLVQNVRCLHWSTTIARISYNKMGMRSVDCWILLKRKTLSSVDELTARLANSENMAHDQTTAIIKLEAEIALFGVKLEAAGSDTMSRVTGLENAFKVHQEIIKHAEEINSTLNAYVHRPKMETAGLQEHVQHKETVILDVNSRLSANDHESSALHENSSWLSIPGLRDNGLLTPPQSSCSSRQETPQRD